MTDLRAPHEATPADGGSGADVGRDGMRYALVHAPLRLAAIGIVVLTLATYLPAIDAGYVWEDDVYVTDNLTLRSLDGLRKIWLEPTASPQYYPLVFTSYWIEYHLQGLNPRGYHLVNIALHAITALLVWKTLRQLGVPGAFLAAALFAVHPVHVESVAWITERKNVLAGVFALLALSAWLTYLASARARDTRVALLWFICALCSKTAVLPLPVVLLLITWWRRPDRLRTAIGHLVPFVMIAALFALQTAWREQMDEQVGESLASFSAVDRFLIAGRALCFYVSKLVWPLDLTTIYPRWQVDASEPWQYAFPITAISIVAILWWLRRPLGKGPLIAVLTFAVGLVPVLGLVDFNFMKLAFVADHLQYLPSIGVLALIASAAVVLATDARSRLNVPSPIPTVLTAVGIAGLSLCSWHQSQIYLDNSTLWRNNLLHNPRAWWAHHNLGWELAQRGNLEEAVQHLQASAHINPNRAEIHNNLGVVLVRLGRVQEALSALRQAANLNPDYASARFNLGVTLVQTRNAAEATAHLEAAARLQPNSADSRLWLGRAYEMQNRTEAAIESYQTALRLDPEQADARQSLDRLLTGRTVEP